MTLKIMKKKYNKPAIEVIQVNLDTIICGTGYTSLTLSFADTEEESLSLTETSWGTGFFSE